MSHQHDSPQIPFPATRHPDAGEDQSNLVSISDSRGIFDDEFERQLQTQSGEDSQLRALLHDYSLFKNRPVKHLFRSILEYIVFQPPSTFQSITPTEEPDMRTFCKALNDLRAALRKDDTGCVRFCVLSLDYNDAVQSKFFLLRARLFATVEQLRRRFRAPISAILIVIREQWKYLENAKIHYNVIPKKRYVRTTVKQPSESSSDIPFTLNTSNDISLELEWMASAPEYRGSFSMYVWQPHTEPPKSKRARFFISQATEQRPRDVLVLLDSWDLSKGSLQKYRFDRSEIGSFKSSHTTSSTGTELYLFIYAAYKSLIEDTTSFINGAYEQLDNFKYTGRQSPSGGKLHFLLHFDDCCRLSSSGLSHARILLNELHQSASTCVPQIDQGLEQWSRKAVEDVDFLRKQLEIIQVEALMVRDMIKDQLDLRNGRRTSLLGLLATIYIPFAWISSLFGMNISGPIWGPLILDATTNNNSSKTVDGSNDSLSLSDNQTDAIVSAISSSGSYLWSFKMYWVITAPVTLATILLPLIAGHVFRSITQFCYENRIYALTISVILLLAGIVLMSVYMPVQVYLPAFGMAFGGIALFAAVYAARTGRYQWLSAGFSMVFAVSIATDWYVVTVFPVTGVVPLVYLILSYFRVEIKDFLGPRLERCRPYINKRLYPPRCHSWIWQAVIVCMYYTSAVYLSYWLPVPSLFIVGIPLGLLGVNRLIYSFANPRPEHKHYWTIYAFVYLSSLLLGYFISSLCLALVPMTYPFAFWLYLDHRRWIDAQLWRFIRDLPRDRNGLAA